MGLITFAPHTLSSKTLMRTTLAHVNHKHCSHNNYTKILFAVFWTSLIFVSDISYAQSARPTRSENPSQSFSFTHLKPDQLASIGSVNRITRDHKGYMWFGGQDGLARYDGYSIEIYKSQFGDASSLSNNYVHDILEDSRGQLWVATRTGLNKYNRDMNTFVHYSSDANSIDSANDNAVLTVFEHSSGALWLGTRGGGLSFYDRASDSFRAFESATEKRLGLSNSVVFSIAEDSTGNLWVGTEKGGLNYLDLQTRQFKHLKHKSKDKRSLSSNDVRSIIVDNKDNLWVGTFGGGLNYYDRSTRKFTRFKAGSKSSKSLTDPYIRDMYIDRDAYLWIATENGGLNKFDPKSRKFVHYFFESDNPTSLASNSPVSLYEDIVGDLWIGLSPTGVDTLSKHLPRFTRYRHKTGDINSLTHNEATAVIEDKKNNLWVGTPNGLNYIDRRSNNITRYKHNPSGPGSIANAKILSLLEDSKERLWVGTEGAGVNRLDPGSGIFTHYPVNSNRSRSISGRNIRVIYEDLKQNIWFGSEAGGLTRYNERTNKFTRYVHSRGNESSLSANMVNVIYEDKAGRLWVGTSDGLDLMDRDRDVFRHFKHDPKVSNTLSANHITSIIEDKTGRLWVGTHGGGVNLLNRKNGTFVSFGVKDGLPNNVITGLLEDGWGNLWLATPKGLTRFDTNAKTYRSYDKRHGLLGNILSNNANIKANNGELIFGGTSGVSIFDPMRVEDNLMIPQVVITDFTILNQPVIVGAESSPLQKVIGETESVTLNQDQSVFSFEFSVLNYRTPEDNKYSYMLEGFDKSWNEVSKKRTATYTNLNAGKYTFRVHGYNNEGVRSTKSAEIEVIVLPKIWQTWRSYIPYIVLVLVAIAALIILGIIIKFSVARYKHLRLEAKKRLAAQRRKKPTKRPVKRLAKSAVKKAVEIPSKVPVKKIIEHVNVKKAPRDPHVTNNKLIPEKKYPSRDQIKPVDIHSIVTAVLMRSKTLMGKKELEIVNQVSKTLQPGLLNEGRLKNALYNLVANSIRISDRGKISVSAEQKGSYLLFKVTNSDIGFSNNKFSSLFNSSPKQVHKDGSTFVFTLPFPLDEEKEATATSARKVVDKIIKSDIKNKNERVAAKPSVHGVKKPATKKAISSERRGVAKPDLNKVDDIPLLDEPYTLNNLVEGAPRKTIQNSFHKKPAKANKSSGKTKTKNNRVKAIVKKGALNKAKKVDANISKNNVKKPAVIENKISTRKGVESKPKKGVVESKPKKGVVKPRVVEEKRAIVVRKEADEKHVERDIVKAVVNDPKKFPHRALVNNAKSAVGIDTKKFVEKILKRDAENKKEKVHVDIVVEKTSNNVPEITPRAMVKLDDSDNVGKVISDCQLKLIKSTEDEDKERAPTYHILIVDDNPVRRMILQNYLSSENYRVSQVESGPEALSLINKSGSIDLMLLGVMLPGITGYQVCEQLRLTHSSQDLPVIFTTDMTNEKDFELCYAVGGNDVLTKQMSKEGFVSRVKKQMIIMEYNRSQEMAKRFLDEPDHSMNKVS